MAARRFSLICVSVACLLLATACTKTTNATEPTSTPSTTPTATSSPTVTPSPSATSSESPSPSPSPSPALADGRYFGYIKSVDSSTSPPTLVSDLAYFYTGDKANQEAAARGDETPVPNDYYIVNDNPLLRTLPIDPTVNVQIIDWMDCCDLVNGTFTSFAEAVAKNHPKGSYHGRLSPYWITVTGGKIVTIEEQYLP